MRFIVESPLSPAEAFGRIADFGSLADWDPFVRNSELIAGERLAAGAVYELTSPGGLRLRYQLIELEPPRQVRYVGGSKRGKSNDTITVTNSGRGSVVEIESTLEFAGWARTVGPLVRLLVWLGGYFVSLPAMRRYLAG